MVASQQCGMNPEAEESPLLEAITRKRLLESVTK
jgi:hypothetical protein